METLIALATLLAAALPHAHPVVVSRYADTPADEGGTPACWRRIPDEDFRRMHARRCASRTLPCGTPVVILHRDGASVCFVLDRGPYGRHLFGDLDLSPDVATEVGIRPPIIRGGRQVAHPGPGHLRVIAAPLGGWGRNASRTRGAELAGLSGPAAGATSPTR